jgi:lipopolysaccharide/colanic/teichoic acid biosynthesis glycosyltransferase
VGATKRGADVAGWLESGERIGVIVPDLNPSTLTDTCNALEARLRRELTNRLDFARLEDFSIELHAYPEPRSAAQHAPWTMNPILYPDLRVRKRKPEPDRLKRLLDVTVSLVLLTLLSPLLLVIAGLVKLTSRGPVLFRQARVGYLAQPFTMIKFRSMHTGSDDKVHQDFISSFIHGNGNHTQGANQNANGAVFKLTNDRRITPFGHFIRKTSLDELPQLWNVLRGDMSLVGPRPPLPYELEQYAPWHRCRVLEAMPGITGLWQVKGRSRTTFDEMVRLDLQYVRTRSLWLDIKLLAATPRAVVSGKGAC